MLQPNCCRSPLDWTNADQRAVDPSTPGRTRAPADNTVVRNFGRFDAHSRVTVARIPLHLQTVKVFLIGTAGKEAWRAFGDQGFCGPWGRLVGWLAWAFGVVPKLPAGEPVPSRKKLRS